MCEKSQPSPQSLELKKTTQKSHQTPARAPRNRNRTQAQSQYTTESVGIRQIWSDINTQKFAAVSKPAGTGRILFAQHGFLGRLWSQQVVPPAKSWPRSRSTWAAFKNGVTPN